MDPLGLSSSGEVRNSSAAVSFACFTARSRLFTAPASHSNLGSTTKKTCRGKSSQVAPARNRTKRGRTHKRSSTLYIVYYKYIYMIMIRFFSLRFDTRVLLCTDHLNTAERKNNFDQVYWYDFICCPHVRWYDLYDRILGISSTLDIIRMYHNIFRLTSHGISRVGKQRFKVGTDMHFP